MRECIDQCLAEDVARAELERRDYCSVSGIGFHGSSAHVTCGSKTITAPYSGAGDANGATARFAGFNPWKTAGAAIEVGPDVAD